jgi:hypothetical protein
MDLWRGDLLERMRSLEFPLQIKNVHGLLGLRLPLPVASPR